MILTKQSICDSFTLLHAGDTQEQIGIITIRFKSRITSEQETISIDIYGELLSHSASPLRKNILRNLIANRGFHISPLPGALETFFHLLLFPQDGVTLLGSILVEDLPDGAEVDIISTCESKESHDEH